MSLEHFGLIFMFGGLFVGIAFGFPLGFLMSGLAIAAGFICAGKLVFYQVVSIVGGGVMRSFVLTAVPLFIFMGSLLAWSGLTQDLYEVLSFLLRRVKGGLAYSTMILAFMISACTGLVAPAVLLTGQISLPPMLSRGYSKKLTSGIVCAGGAFSAMIPPSVLMLIIAPEAGISSAKLFVASLIPGALLLLFHLGLIFFLLRLHGSSIPPLSSKRLSPSIGEISWRVVKTLLPLVFLIIGVIASMFFGIARPAEAGALGATGALLLVFLKGKLNFLTLKRAVHDCVRVTSMALFVILGASLFSSVYIRLGGDQIIRDFVMKLAGTSSEVALIIMLFLIIMMGMLVDCVGTIFILTPVFLPIAGAFGFNILWVGVFIAIGLGIAHLTPPVTLAALFLKGIAPEDVRLSDIYKGILPFLIPVFLLIGLIYFCPQLVLWLPSLMG